MSFVALLVSAGTSALSFLGRVLWRRAKREIKADAKEIADRERETGKDIDGDGDVGSVGGVQVPPP